MLVDKKSGRELHSGDSLVRKDYKGIKHRYELLSISQNNERVQVRELLNDDTDKWAYYTIPIQKLGLEWQEWSGWDSSLLTDVNKTQVREKVKLS